MGYAAEHLWLYIHGHGLREVMKILSRVTRAGRDLYLRACCASAFQFLADIRH